MTGKMCNLPELARPPPAQPEKGPVTQQEVSNVYRALVALYTMGCSASMIVFNKWLMQKDRFPFAPALTCMHMTTGFLFAFVMLQVRPELFWGLGPVRNAEEGFFQRVLKLFVPLGVLYAGNLVLANQAYKYCSVAFLQMMKECNIPFAYFMGIPFGLDTFDWTRFVILNIILAAAMNFVAGEIQFSTVGFFIQFGSQCFEICRITMQSWLLQGSRKVDSLTLMLFMCPCCLTALVCIATYYWDPVIPVKVWENRGPLLVSCVLSVMLNMGTILLQQVASSSMYMLTGVCKDVVCISVSALVLMAPMTPRQVAACFVALGGIVVHTLYRTRPELFSRASAREMSPSARAPSLAEHEADMHDADEQSWANGEGKAADLERSSLLPLANGTESGGPQPIVMGSPSDLAARDAPDEEAGIGGEAPAPNADGDAERRPGPR